MTTSSFAQESPDKIAVPIGTILPFIGAPETLPGHWVLCDGRTVTDPDSPLRGTVLPDLTDDRFLMGVGSADSVGTSGGDNTLSPDGAHSHVGSTAGRPNQQSGTPRHLNSRGDRGFQHSHDLSIRQDGAHTHGGDNRPRFFAVRFIIRVK